MQCLTNKVDTSSYNLKTYGCSVTFVNEHWMTIDSGYIIVQGYQIVWNGIFFESMDDVNAYSIERNVEIAAAKVPHMGLTLLSLYRPPKGEIVLFVTQMELALNAMAQNSDDNFILAGDFNVDLLTNSSEETKII
ncbi:hypothetical protein HHI36_015009 [Cryptolaemus montrouzieri]|uniref:Endonuclease/exonuclease/phosphatase domain-containing protein n=1 Tax=Cryptolaemus montrouzieri TaxID=559131 RepID=A0ABD2N5B4_9CUCU